MKQSKERKTRKKEIDWEYYKRPILYSCIFAVFLGVAVLAYSVLLEHNILSPEVTGHLPMAKDAASCFILSGLALWGAGAQTKSARIVSRIMALLIVATAFLSVIQNNFPEVYKRIFILGDHIYFGMAKQTAIAFVLTGLAIFFIRVKRAKLPVQLLLHSVTLISGIVIFGHILKIPHLYNFNVFENMSIYTAVGLGIFTITATLFNPTTGLTAIYTGNKIGNIMARRLSSRIMVVAFLITYLKIMAYRNGWVSQELGIALYALAFLITTLVLIFATSMVLNEMGTKKEIAKYNFKALVKSAPNALVMSDTEGNIALVNREANKIFGYGPNEMEGRSLDIIVPEKYRTAHREKQPQYANNPHPRHFSAISNLYALKKDGTEFPIEIGITPIKTEKGIVALASIVDITERKQQEEIIRNQLIELQLKNEEMEQFNYISSHDLQEPLRTMSNYIQMIEEDYGDRIDNEVKTHLGTMQSAIDRMSHMVKSLLSYGKLGRKRKLSLTNCHEIVDEVIADLDSMIKANGAKIHITCGLPEFYAYRTELRQLFQNLIANAIKFHKQDANPEVWISSRENGGYYEFTVSDNGIGIDPKDHDKIFRIFQRLNSEEDYEGHGIGLANCKKIAEMHGGRIWVEPGTEKGSTFKFTILNVQQD